MDIVPNELFLKCIISDLSKTRHLVTSIVLSFMLQENIENDINKVNIKDELEKAVADVNAMNQWDDMQARFETMEPLN